MVFGHKKASPILKLRSGKQKIEERFVLSQMKIRIFAEKGNRTLIERKVNELKAEKEKSRGGKKLIMQQNSIL